MDNEKEFDEFLGVSTMEHIGAEVPGEENNIYQATYYRDLVTLFNKVSMEPEDTLVDMGCGLGRVLFYGNSRHYCRTKGIEVDPEIYASLMGNVSSYQSKFYDQEDRMMFYNMSAQDYPIADEDNYFYFFNPFSVNVFRTVIQNIINSMKRSPRDIYIMLYYPTFEYQKVIRDSRYFILKDIIRLTDYYKDPDEKVYVYHMSRYFV